MGEVKRKTEIKGLKKLRANADREAKFYCENCECKRYSPCGCKRKEKK